MSKRKIGIIAFFAGIVAFAGTYWLGMLIAGFDGDDYKEQMREYILFFASAASFALPALIFTYPDMLSRRIVVRNSNAVPRKEGDG